MRGAGDPSLDRPPRLPAWTASLLLHAALAGVTLWAAAPKTPAGAAEQPSREIGVVLRRGPVEPFAPADDSSPDEPIAEAESAAPVADAAAAFGPPDTPSPFAGLLEQMTALGEAAPAAGGADGDAARPSRGRDLPIGHTSTSFFGVEGTGSRFVYVLDRSVSMAGPPLAAAKRELVASLAALEDIHRFQILFFNHRLSTFDITAGQRRVAPATDQNKRRAEKYVRGVTADGSTDRYGALAHALRLGPDVVFFLTDAEDEMTAEQLRKIVRLNNRAGATIGTIEFGRGPRRDEKNFLNRLAEATGGQYGYVDTLRLGL